MNWELAATQAVDRYVTAQEAAGAEHSSPGQRLWTRLRASLRREGPGAVEAKAAPEQRAPGYYVDYSDWPIARSADDSSPEQAIAALRGLSDYYGAAMESLRKNPKDKDGR
jgi:hypothetical protein